MTTVLRGLIDQSMTRDSERHRDFDLTYLVESDDMNDGPAVVARTAGLPVQGQPYILGNDIDIWAWCHPDMSINQYDKKDGENSYFWEVKVKFSSKPPNKDSTSSSTAQRCSELNFENPILEPPKINGGFTKNKEEATHDRYGQLLQYSSFEQIRGPQVEFDVMHPTVSIEQNVINPRLSLLTAMRDGVNDRPMWGMPARTIKLSSIKIERRYYGLCYAYYNRVLEFEGNYKGFDRTVLDESNKVLSGRWDSAGDWVDVNIGGSAPDYLNPSHYIVAVDKKNHNHRQILDGRGRPFNPDRILTCADCPNPTPPEVWILGSIRGDYVELSHNTSCQWISDDSNTELVRGTVNGTPTWVLTEFFEDDNATLTWTASVASWDCHGPNLLAPLNHPFPIVGVSPKTAGSRRIEKYPSVNFFLLGVPRRI